MDKLLLSIFILLPLSLLASRPFDGSKYDGPSLIGNYCAVFEGGLNDSTEILHNDVEWVNVETPIVPLEVPANGKWVKADLSNIPNGKQRYLLEVNLPTLDTLLAYIVHEDQIVRRFSYFESLPFDSRDIDHQAYLIRLPKGIPNLEVYFYVSSVEQVNLPITFASYPDQYVEATKRDLTFGVYVGIILAMFFYNTFILYSTKDKSYVYYVLYIMFVGLVQVSLGGYGFKYIWPDSPGWQQVSVNFLNLGTAFFAYLFFQNFVRLQSIMPKWKWPFYMAIGMYVIQFILALMGYGANAYAMMNLTALILSFLFIFASGVAIYKGSRQAIFFMIAWSAFLVSVIIFVLKDVGVVQYNLFTANILQIGSGLEAVLLSFGLADRISTLRRDRNESQQRALEISLENERIIREQNRVLEERVAERTSELNQALLDVKNAQSQMVEQEKMASLGQLTAGIAHEINNPINFVSANINPLTRDLDDVFELVDQYDSISSKEEFENKKPHIEDYKDEIDFTYVREEISQLISGIKDGAKRTAEIVRGLKLFSRTDEQDLKKIDLIDGIESTLTLLKSSMVAGVKIERIYEPVERIECYGGKMNQVFMNILSNSIQAIQEKQMKAGVIVISTKSYDDHVTITFKDNAGGIPEENMSKIFDPFFTTKPVGSGTGLGLAIAKGIVDSHLGKIEVESTVGSGTKFTITLPKTQPQEND